MSIQVWIVHIRDHLPRDPTVKFMDHAWLDELPADQHGTPEEGEHWHVYYVEGANWSMQDRDEAEAEAAERHWEWRERS